MLFLKVFIQGSHVIALQAACVEGGDCACADVARGRVPGLPRILAIAAGRYHSLAADARGRAWAWGLDACGLGSRAGAGRGPHLVRRPSVGSAHVRQALTPGRKYDGVRCDSVGMFLSINVQSLGPGCVSLGELPGRWPRVCLSPGDAALGRQESAGVADVS